MFQQITISISLNMDMEKDLPKSGPGEIEAMDKFAAQIGRATSPWLDGLYQDLADLGYVVHIES